EDRILLPNLRRNHALVLLFVRFLSQALLLNPSSLKHKLRTDMLKHALQRLEIAKMGLSVFGLPVHGFDTTTVRNHRSGSSVLINPERQAPAFTIVAVQGMDLCAAGGRSDVQLGGIEIEAVPILHHAKGIS